MLGAAAGALSTETALQAGYVGGLSGTDNPSIIGGAASGGVSFLAGALGASPPVAGGVGGAAGGALTGAIAKTGTGLGSLAGGVGGLVGGLVQTGLEAGQSCGCKN